MASEKKITMREYNGTDYDTLYPKTIAEQVDGVYSQTETNALLAKKPNPNLIDNWYFGNPIDQRGGYVAPPGVPYWIDGSAAGATDDYYTVIEWNSSGNGVISINGSKAAVDKQYCVRGYTGTGYGIDRWNMNGDTSTILLQEGVVELVLGSGYQTLNQDIENLLNFRGKIFTASILVESLNGGSFSLMAYDGADYYGYNTRITTPGVHSLTFAVGRNATTLRILLQNRSETETLTVKVKAIKLELGSQQTLAHQDTNGNWVLNEIPDYWEELLKCIQSTADPGDTFANKTVLHTGNAQALGFPKIAIGSYVGTGTSDPFNGTKQNSLTFDFEPKMLAVVADGSNMFFAGFLIVRGQTYSDGIGSFGNSTVALNLHITWSGNTVSWWSSNRTDVGTKYPQMNAENVTYRYVALG